MVRPPPSATRTGSRRPRASRKKGPQSRPLSWKEARARLKELLENYLSDPPPVQRPCSTANSNSNGEATTAFSDARANSSSAPLNNNNGSNGSHHTEQGGPSTQTNDSPEPSCSLLSHWTRLDLDIYAGSLTLSVALLVLSILSWRDTTTSIQRLPTAHSLAIHRAELAAAVLLVTGSLTSVWVVRRRRYLCLNDSDTVKRRDIRKFLRLEDATATTMTLDENEETNGNDETAGTKDTSTNANAAPDSNNHNNKDEDGKAEQSGATGVYPVYRRHDIPTDAVGFPRGSWSKVPSLLLVEGDWIALQMGDICPATCRSTRHHSFAGGGGPSDTFHYLPVGERLTPDRIRDGSDNASASALPRGRTTLSPRQSPQQLLTLCQQMQIFVVTEPPLKHFLRRRCGRSHSSQVSRQLKAVRETLFLTAMVLLVVTTILVVGRYDFASSSSSFGDATRVVHLPILAALSVLPVVGPAYLFGLEVLGTARILTTVHAYSSPTADPVRDTPSRLLRRYIVATGLTRLELWGVHDTLSNLWSLVRGTSSSIRQRERSKLVRVPPASVNLLEKLGVATAFALVDDELACEPQSVPQQLLVPSGKGLKLLDLCLAHEDADDGSDEESDSEDAGSLRRQQMREKSFDSDSEESDEGTGTQTLSTFRRKVLPKRLRRHRRIQRSALRAKNSKSDNIETDNSDSDCADREHSRFEVQFEEPNWWQHLPSLKGIGLACMLLDDGVPQDSSNGSNIAQRDESTMHAATSSLVQLVCNERRSRQLRALAECIGISTEPNGFGPKGDLSMFTEKLRLHVLSTQLFRDRLKLDAHERSSEQSRWWGLIRPDSSSVIVQDSRTKAYQLLTVGDPSVVMNQCSEAWQGEISTILPLDKVTKETIRTTTDNWKLGDLDVAAFSYTPVPHTLETRLNPNVGNKLYLLDNADPSSSITKDKSITNNEWSFVKNQVFLGVLGSLVVPRSGIKGLLDVLADAGVRFVYFSSRNMRRQKELAIQMGIDVAWNCAISLRPLESGQDIDQHRMVSAYADWDVNAKLPHGVKDVRKHLEEVDNVPLLVSLFTDVTKRTISEMVEVFQEYNDTVVAVGLSHVTRNEEIFSRANISVGIDTLTDLLGVDQTKSSNGAHIRISEWEFVQSITAHSCAFRFQGASSVSYIATILEKSRTALEAAIASSVFVTTACLSFGIFVLLSACSPLIRLPFVPSLGSILYLQLLLPCLAFSIALCDGDDKQMKQVPPKNDRTVTFSRNESLSFYSKIVCKGILPALLPQILHIIVFGEIIIHSNPTVVEVQCPGSSYWADLVRCDLALSVTDKTSTSAGTIVFSEFAFCIIGASGGFVHRFLSFSERKPWERSRSWLISVFISLSLVILYLFLTIDKQTIEALPWYFYVVSILNPCLCLFAVDFVKRTEIKAERRAEKLRRLQFETRLGAWSPR